MPKGVPNRICRECKRTRIQGEKDWMQGSKGWICPSCNQRDADALNALFARTFPNGLKIIV